MSNPTPNQPDVTPARVVARTGPAVGMRGGLKVLIPGLDAAVTRSADDDDYVFPETWATAYVKASSQAGIRVFVIEPDPTADERIEYAGRYVRGAFRVVRKVSGKRADEAWAAAKRVPPSPS